jgi:hypothetical protein
MNIYSNYFSEENTFSAKNDAESIRNNLTSKN